VYAGGSIGEVTSIADGDIGITAAGGGIGSVEATAWSTVTIYASDDIGSVDATAGAYVGVTSGNGSIGDVDLTTNQGGSIDVRAADNIESANLDSSAAVFVYADGSIGEVTSVAGGYTEIVAGEDIDSVTATTTGGEDSDIVVVSFGNGDIGSVIADASDELIVLSYGGSVDSVTGSAVSALVLASDTVGAVDLTLSAGEDHYYFGGSLVDAAIIGNQSVGSVTVGLDTSDESLEVVVGSLGDVGDVTVNLGQTSTATIDIHAQSDDAVTVALTANVDNDSSINLFVGSALSDPDSTGPATLNLSSNGVTSDGDSMGIDLTLTDNLGTGTDEVSLLETINFTGDSNVSVFALELVETLTTWDGSTATGDQRLVFGVNDVNDQVVSVSTGSGDDDVNLVYQSSDDHGDVYVSLGAGNDSVDNDWFIGDFAAGSLTIDSGSGSDDIYVRAGAGADINIVAGSDNDTIEIESAVEVGEARLAEGADLAALPGGYVDVSIDVDAGSGDDVVIINANRESIEAGTFAMGDGTNELYFNYHPSSTPLWSDSDIARFTAEMGDNVTGGVHTLGLNVDLDISDDVTLALPGDGGVSVLEIGEIELVTDDAAHGSTLTIDGAAADFTISMAYSSGDDLGDGTSSDEWMDEDVLRLALNGVTDLTIDADDIGVLLDASQNSSLESVTVTSGNDDIDLGLVGFTGGLDVSVQSGTNGSSGNDAQVFAFGGEYGSISVVSSDDEAILTIEAADENAGVDVGAYTFTAESVTISSIAGEDYSYQEAELEIDGYTVDDDSSDIDKMGVATVNIGSVTMKGDQDSDIDIFDLSDGSSVTLGSVDIDITTYGEDYYDNGGIEIENVRGSSVTLGDIDVDIQVDDGEDQYNTFVVNVLDVTDSSVTLGNISVDRVSGEDEDSLNYWSTNDVEITVANVGRSTVEVGDINADLAAAGFSLELVDNDNSEITVGDVTTIGEDGEVRIGGSVATSDGADVLVTLGDITMHDDVNNQGLFMGPTTGEDGLSVAIVNNVDDFTAGMVEVTLGDISLSGSDSAEVIVGSNTGEFELFNTPLVPLVGVQIEMGDIDIDLDATGEDVVVAGISVTDNVAAHITMGNVSATLGSDEGAAMGYWIDVADGNYETVYNRGDTAVAIGSDAGGYGYSYLAVSDNSDSEVTFGDYTVSVGQEGEGAALGFLVAGVGDNDGSTITFGDFALTVDGNSDAGFAALGVLDNIDSTVTFGNVTLDGASDSTLYVFNNDESTIELGDVDLGGVGRVAVDLNDSSTVEMGDVVITGEGSDAGSIGGFYGGEPGLNISDNDNSTVTVGDFSSTETYVDTLVHVDNNVGSTIEVGDVSLENVGTVSMDLWANTDSTVTVGNVMVSDATGDFVLNIEENVGTDASVTVGNVEIDGVNAVDVDIHYNNFATVTVGNVAVSDSTGDFDLFIGEQTDASVTVGNVSINTVGAVDLSLSANTDSTVTVGDVMVSGATGDFGLTIEDNQGTDASMTVGNVSIDGVSAVDIIVTDNVYGTVTVGNVMVSDATEGFFLGIDDNAGTDASVTMGNVDIDGVGSVHIDIYDNNFSTVTVGNVTVSDASSGFSLHVGYQTDASVTVGNVLSTAGIDGTIDIEVTDNMHSTITIGDMTFSDGVGTFYLDVERNTDAEVTIGHITYSSCDDDNVNIDVRQNQGTDAFVTIGDMSFHGIDDFDLDVYYNDHADITIGNILVSDSTDNFDLSIEDNDGTDASVTIGNVTKYGDGTGDSVEVEIESNDDGDVSLGNLFFSDIGTFDLVVNDNDGSMASDATVVLGDVTAISVDSVDVKVTDHDYASVTIGDMLFSDGSGSVGFHFTDNDNTTVVVGDFTYNGTSGDFRMSVTDSDFSTITLGSISSTQTSGSGADLWIEDNSSSTIGSDSSSITLSTNFGGIYVDIDDNTNSTIMFSDVTLTNATGLVDVDIMDGEIGDNDSTSVSIGDLTVSAGTNVNIDIDGDSGIGTANYAAVGDIDVTVTGAGAANDVDIELNAVDGADSITVSGNVATLDIRLGDDTATLTTTSLIDMSGMTNESAEIFIDFVDDSGFSDGDDAFAIGSTPLTPVATGDANLSDDIVIKFGEFESAYVETFINDHYDTNNLQDLDGVRQTYVFEGSDIGDIIIEGFVAGFGAYRDVDIVSYNSDGDSGGRGPGDGGDEVGSDWFDYGTTNANGLVQLRTDRLDFSQFEGVESLDDLSFEYDDETDSVIITAADGQFDGRIIVTGTGVDSDNGDSVESIIDRVADSIIFG
jgi:hypothetical protein